MTNGSDSEAANVWLPDVLAISTNNLAYQAKWKQAEMPMLALPECR